MIECSDSSLDKDLQIKTKVYAEVKIHEYNEVKLSNRKGFGLLLYEMLREHDFAM